MNICYIVRDYISFKKTATNYQECIDSLGIELVKHPADADVVILHGLISDIDDWFLEYPVLRSKYVIGYFVWETDALPQMYYSNLEALDEVWTCSTYAKAALIRANVNTFVIPHVAPPIETTPEAMDLFKQRIGYKEGIFYFYTIGRMSDPRKNILATVRALSSVVVSGKVHLLIKDIAHVNQSFGRPMSMPAGVQIVRDDFDENVMSALHLVCNCCVSSHFSEAWGLGLSEAMTAGNVAVATGYSGNMDFMTKNNSFPVGFDLSTIQRDVASTSKETLTEDMKWAYIRESEYQNTLRNVLDSWDELEIMRHQAQADMTRFSSSKVSELIGNRLSALNLPGNPKLPSMPTP